MHTNRFDLHNCPLFSLFPLHRCRPRESNNSLTVSCVLGSTGRIHMQAFAPKHALAPPLLSRPAGSPINIHWLGPPAQQLGDALLQILFHQKDHNHIPSARPFKTQRKLWAPQTAPPSRTPWLSPDPLAGLPTEPDSYMWNISVSAQGVSIPLSHHQMKLPVTKETGARKWHVGLESCYGLDMRFSPKTSVWDNASIFRSELRLWGIT